MKHLPYPFGRKFKYIVKHVYRNYNVKHIKVKHLKAFLLNVQTHVLCIICHYDTSILWIFLRVL